MLKHWQSHQEYLFFLHEAKVNFDSSLRKRLSSELTSAREKLRLLDLDPVMELLAPFYSGTGRPAKKTAPDTPFSGPDDGPEGYQSYQLVPEASRG